MIAILRPVVFAAALLSPAAFALENTWIYTVQATATVQASPARVDLAWPADTQPANGFTVYRKAIGDTAWGSGIVLGGDATGYSDTDVATGGTYEYKIEKRADAFTGYGYIAVGINAPLVDNRGTVILVVDASIAGPLAAEITRLQRDLVGDGWMVVRHDVPRDGVPADLRAQIRADYTADPAHVKAVFLLGHVPVVLSGNLNPDGHDLLRPFPADAFYGDVDGNWTDMDGDGVYDQSQIPSDLELEVGRVDFADLPGTYSPIPYPSETDLLRRYLDKDHAFRQAIVRPAVRALMGNAIGDGDGQAYAASGYRNFAPLVGPRNVVNASIEPDTADSDRWISRLVADDYLWAYGCGAGSATTISTLGTHGVYHDVWATDFWALKPKAEFYLLFGSWFVEWNKPDDLLRSALAAPDYGLAAAWSGRPHLFFHHMGIGETIGYGIRLSQNNDGQMYQNAVQHWNRGVHIALLGDPTLRLNQVAPPTQVSATATGADVTLAWHGSTDTVLGYHVYRGASSAGPFTRLTDAPIAATSFTDPGRAGTGAVYLVRAVTLQVGPSGSYYNASEGAFAAFGAAPATAAAAPRETVWVDDALPAGAIGYATANDRWQWVSANPTPFSGTLAHQSTIAAGVHHHFFNYANPPLAIGAGDTLFAYVFLDPANPPSEVMLTWCADNWEHRAYWGDNLIAEGADNSAGRRYMGALPPAGQWVRLEVPASAVGLEGLSPTGMGFSLVNGRATWDRAGKATQ